MPPLAQAGLLVLASIRTSHCHTVQHGFTSAVMKLIEKGRYAPPPRLPVHAQAVARVLGGWRRVHARTHWLLGNENEVDGADFYVGEHELGHIHLQGEAHIAVTRSLRNALVAAGLAEPFRWSQSFVVYSVEAAAHVAHALALFELAYDQLHGVSSAELVARSARLAPALLQNVPVQAT